MGEVLLRGGGYGVVVGVMLDLHSLLRPFVTHQYDRSTRGRDAFDRFESETVRSPRDDVHFSGL